MRERLGLVGQTDPHLIEVAGWVLDHIDDLDPTPTEQTLTTHSWIISAIACSGHVNDAISRYQHLLAAERRVLDPDHPNSLTTRAHIAYWIGNSGRFEDALARALVLVADQERVLGSDHPDTFVTRNNIAWWNVKLGRFEDAAEQFQALLADREGALGALITYKSCAPAPASHAEEANRQF